MKNDLISVIVPIYNVGKYLRKCIDSILAQTYESLEIILVDDGSTDESGAICDVYKEKDERIKVVHKENGGLTSARKAGANVATGHFVTFVDGDDWIEPLMYEAMICKTELHADIISSGMYRDNNEGTYMEYSPSDFFEPGFYSGESLAMLREKVFENGIFRMNGSLNNKLFRKKLLSDALHREDNSITRLEDDRLCFVMALFKAESFEIIKESYYHGVDREGSATHSRINDYYSVCQMVIDCYKRFFSELTCSDSLKKDYNAFFVNLIYGGIKHVVDDYYVPEYYWPEKGSVPPKTVVIYGGGEVGESYYYSFTHNNSFFVKMIVDCYRDKTSRLGIETKSPESILDCAYDEIIIAVEQKKVADSIRDCLLGMGIDEERIKWARPKKTA